ncbi:MAG: hypothetical protein U0X40_04970 [Ferruginibacter sp.]
MRFRILLKNDKQLFYRRTGLLILLLHFFFFNYYLFKAGAAWPVVAGVAITTVFLAMQILSRRIPRVRLPDAIAFLLLAITWLCWPVYWMAALMLFLAAMAWKAAEPLRVDFSAEQVVLSSFPPKKIAWPALNQVILKDRILTIDFKNDHLLQAEIAEQSYDVEEDAFNAFCREFC